MPSTIRRNERFFLLSNCETISKQAMASANIFRSIIGVFPWFKLYGFL